MLIAPSTSNDSDSLLHEPVETVGQFDQASYGVEDHAMVSRGMTLSVAERACEPIIGLRYGLLLYFAR